MSEKDREILQKILRYQERDRKAKEAEELRIMTHGPSHPDHPDHIHEDCCK